MMTLVFKDRLCWFFQSFWSSNSLWINL